MELLVSMAFLSLALLSLMMMNSYSSKSSMDTYYEYLAFSLAREPIEVFRSFGYRWLKTYDNHPLARYPANAGPAQIIDSPTDPDQHPFEAGLFEREISISDATFGGTPALRDSVAVRPVKRSRVEPCLRRGKDDIRMEALIVDGPK